MIVGLTEAVEMVLLMGHWRYQILGAVVWIQQVRVTFLTCLVVTGLDLTGSGK
jgi:hypothetical protein